MGKKIIGIILSFVMAMASFANAEKVKLTTMNWAPYIGKDLADQGFIAEITRAAFKAGGVDEVEIFYLPWGKAVELAKMGNADGLFPVWENKNLKVDFNYSSSMPCGPVAFIKMKGKEFNYTGKFEELKPYKIGVVAGYVNTEEIDKATDLTKIEAKDDMANIQNLLAGKVDVAILDPLVATNIIKNDKNLAPFLEKIETVKPVLRHTKLYIAFSKKSANADALMQKFNDGIAKIEADGSLETILKKHKIEDIVK